MHKFTQTGLSEDLLTAIKEMGFETPTPIQEKTIPAILNSDTDLIALAQTGTGKTAAYGLPIIQQIEADTEKIQALILCPTRELCIQIAKDFDKFAKFKQSFTTVAVYGGASIETQIKALKKGANIVVATPGRAIDLMKRRVLKLHGVKWLVLDEADEMLNMGFQEDLDTILAETPENKQTLLFSATMPDEIMKISRKYMNNPTIITVGKKNVSAENVKHEYYVVHAKDRYHALKRIVDINPSIYGIVFCRTRQETKEIAEKLMSDGYNADALHGDLSQAQRDHVMGRFRIKHLQVLVATDVAARGLDVDNLTHIINYNLPDELEVYIHRSGRTGRAGKSGISISILHTRETNKIKQLEKLTNKSFEKKLIPSGKEICAKQLYNLIDKVEKIEVNESQIEEYLPLIYQKLEWLSREDLIKHFVSVEFNRFLAYYENSIDLNLNTESIRGESDYAKKRQQHVDMSRYFINLGSHHKIKPNDIIAVINERTPGKSIRIGRIDIMKKFSFFDADIKLNEELKKSFRKIIYEGVPVIIELSKPDSKDNSEQIASEPKKRRPSFRDNKSKSPKNYREKEKRAKRQ